MNEILDELRYDPELGGLFYKDVRYLLIRPETLRGLPGEALLAGGRTGGRLSGQRYQQALDLDDEQAVAFMCRMAGQIGWGAMSLESLDRAQGKLVVAVRGSPFAEAHGPSEHGVCQLIEGVIAGLAEGLFGMTVTSAETACVARGDELCRFATRTSQSDDQG